MRLLLSVVLGVSLATAASADPMPTKPVSQQFFTGRWFEIARSINPNQKDCEAPTYDFAPQVSGGPRFTLTCRKGSPTGPADRLNVRIRLPKGDDAARFRVSALGGLVGADYTILDHDEAYSWAVLTMGDGHYVWLLARKPAMDASLRGLATARIRALGYDLAQLVYPRW